MKSCANSPNFVFKQIADIFLTLFIGCHSFPSHKSTGNSSETFCLRSLYRTRGARLPRELLQIHGNLSFSNTHWKSFFPENFHFSHFENFQFVRIYVTFSSSVTFDSESRKTQRKIKHWNRGKREMKSGGKFFLIFSSFNQFFRGNKIWPNFH